MANKAEEEFTRLQKEMDELANKPENWIQGGDIALPSKNIAHVFWNRISLAVAIKYEKKEVGGDKMLILQRAGETITAENLQQASTVAHEFYWGKS